MINFKSLALQTLAALALVTGSVAYETMEYNNFEAEMNQQQSGIAIDQYDYYYR